MFLRWGKFRGRVKGFKHWIQKWHQTFLVLLDQVHGVHGAHFWGGISPDAKSFSWSTQVIEFRFQTSRSWILRWLELMFLVDLVLLGVPRVDIFDFRNKFGLPALCCPELPGAEAEPQVPNPLAMLPPLAWSVKPLIFSWNSRTLWDDFLWSWELLGLLRLLSLSFLCTIMGSPGQGMMCSCFDTMILLSLSAWQDDCGMATGKSSEAFGVLPDHGFPLGNQTIQIIQAMEM